MDRYIIIDLKEKEIMTANLVTINDINGGSSVKCIDNSDLIAEMKNTLDETEKMLLTEKYY